MCCLAHRGATWRNYWLPCRTLVCRTSANAATDNTPLFLAAITIGELRRGVELIRHRGDQPQSKLLEQWLAEVLQTYGDRAPNPHNAIDNQIAAIALLHDLTVKTRTIDDFACCGVRLPNPFQAG